MHCFDVRLFTSDIVSMAMYGVREGWLSLDMVFKSCVMFTSWRVRVWKSEGAGTVHFLAINDSPSSSIARYVVAPFDE